MFLSGLSVWPLGSELPDQTEPVPCVGGSESQLLGDQPSPQTGVFLKGTSVYR